MRPRLALAAGAAGLICAVLLADRACPPRLARVHALATAILDDRGALLDAAPAPDGAFRLAATPDQVDPAYLRLLLANEDRRFFRHPGVDPFALLRAGWQLASRLHVVSGGSTLTMQVARLLTPHRHDWRGKLRDIARALQLEAHFSKPQILTMYLTLTPEGGALEGVRAASLAWFGHEPAHLSASEAALLVAVPRSPTRLRPDRHPQAARDAVVAVLARGGAPNPFPLLPAVQPLPHLAPHLRERLAGQAVRTMLDGALQRTVLALAAREQPWLGPQADLAVLVVRNRDRAIRAYVGGDYFGPGGMNDMLRARRSPGSTLKPFIYGLAFDDGLIRPDSRVEDARDRLGDYAPQDFDRVFHGPVTAAEALRQSYNLPAVALLARIGAARFVAALRQAGAVLALPHRGSASLPVALGGIAISPCDLAMLYAGLADDGRVAPLRLLASAPAAPATGLLSGRAAGEVSAILRDAFLPDGYARPARPIAFKTGTSYGFRDAWAAGWSPAYTVVVWTGRADGTPRPGAFGRETAAPILLHVFDLLPAEPALHAPADAPAPPSALPTLAQATPLRILYPPPGAVVEADDGGVMVPVGLEATGGTSPYRWLVDGAPLARVAIGASTDWTPGGIGFARITVVDRENRYTSELVRVR